MKRDLIVTLANKEYINQAKQLFSSIYFNAGWKGDYMLLAHEIPEKELKWFRRKGILIRKCKPLHKKKTGLYPTIFLDKFYLFTQEFKKWKNIVYLDADIIVNGSLDQLTRIKYFGAVGNPSIRELLANFMLSSGQNIPRDNKKYKSLTELNNKYNLNEEFFNAGVFAFHTKLIRNDTFSKLIELSEEYHGINIYGDQPILNLFFYKKWKKLAMVFNLFYTFMDQAHLVKHRRICGLVTHFSGPNEKPWLNKNPFYSKWRSNLDKAELIDLTKIQKPEQVLTPIQIRKYSTYFKMKHILHSTPWKVSTALKKIAKRNSPKAYDFIKKLRCRYKKS